MTLIEDLTFGEDSKPRRLLGCGAAFAKGSAEDVTKENKKNKQTSKQPTFPQCERRCNGGTCETAWERGRLYI